MKRNDLNAIITGIVHRYIEDGWVLEMSNASYSDVEGVHFLSRGLDPRILFECRAPKRAFDWLVPENAIGERVFFKVADDWYVEDICSFEEAKAKRRERWMSRNEEREASLCSFHPTKAFLDKWVRGEYGWKTVKPSDVLVKRERICGRGFYFITKVSRKGANPVLTVDIPRVR